MNLETALSRRSFMKTASLAGAAVVLGGGKVPGFLLEASENPASAPPAPSWVDKPMRWAQLTLVEDDPGKFDLAVLAGLLPAHPLGRRLPERRRLRGLLSRRRFRFTIAAGGWATAMCLANSSPAAANWAWWSSCAPIRTRPTMTRRPAHPDWIAVDAEGRPRRHWASPEMWVTCGLGPYNFEFMTEVKKEIMSRYRVDAIFINRWDGSGMCYCEHCRREFPGGDGSRTAAHERPAGPGASRLHPLAAATAV